jgi:TRAP-type C4-dicarboxylate transport system permease small subunit
MEVSMAYFYAAGLFFSAVAFLFVLSDFWKLVSGQLKDTELIGVVESEEDIPAQPAGAKS